MTEHEARLPVPEIFEDSIPCLNYDGEDWVLEDAYMRLQDEWRSIRAQLRELLAEAERQGDKYQEPSNVVEGVFWDGLERVLEGEFQTNATEGES